MRWVKGWDVTRKWGREAISGQPAIRRFASPLRRTTYQNRAFDVAARGEEFDEWFTGLKALNAGDERAYDNASDDYGAHWTERSNPFHRSMASFAPGGVERYLRHFAVVDADCRQSAACPDTPDQSLLERDALSKCPWADDTPHAAWNSHVADRFRFFGSCAAGGDQ